MSVAQQISKLMSLNARGLIDDDELAFAIRELRAEAVGASSREEKKAVSPAVPKRAKKAAKKGAKRARAAKSAADDEWDRLLDETLEGAKRYDAEHNAEVRLEDLAGMLPTEYKHDDAEEEEEDDVKYEKDAYLRRVPGPAGR